MALGGLLWAPVTPGHQIRPDRHRECWGICNDYTCLIHPQERGNDHCHLSCGDTDAATEAKDGGRAAPPGCGRFLAIRTGQPEGRCDEGVQREASPS